jgi:glutamate--cysteine ligase
MRNPGMMGEMLKPSLGPLLLNRKDRQARKIGVEVERFLIDSTGRPLNYSQGAEPLLKSILKASSDWKVALEWEGHPLALSSGEDILSLEPGGQVELAISPSEDLVEWVRRSEVRELEIRDYFPQKDWDWLWTGVHPWAAVDEVELIPSARYQLMSKFYEKHSTRGREMMRLTTGFHVNLDYRSEEEALKMLKAGSFLSPLWVALFANSPFQFGRRTGHFSERAMIWLGNDPKRSGFLPFLFGAQDLSSYVNFVETSPLMFYYDENDKVHSAEGKSWSQLSSCLQEKNQLTALRQIFHELRLKPCCIEVRSFDSLPPALRLGAVALCLGIFYDEENLQFYEDQFSRSNLQSLRERYETAARQSLLSDLFFEDSKLLFQKAMSALKRRHKGEEVFLEPVEELLRQRKSPAMLALESEWGRSFP